jgi:amino acid transporter
MIFHALGLDYVSKYTKIISFCLLVLNPLLIVIGLMIYNAFSNFVEPPPQLIPANTQQGPNPNQVIAPAEQ